MKTAFNEKIILAPLSGCSDLAFRLIAREMGARLAFFEMVSARSLVHGNPRTRDLLATADADRPIAAQLLGSEPDIMLAAAGKVRERAEISFLDVNSACPVRKVTSKKAGAYLLQDPERLLRIISTLANGLEIPVTVKLRLGDTAVDREWISRLAAACAEAGAAAIFIHGRTRTQGYAGGVDYDGIRAVRESVKIPVFGSGDVFDGPSAKLMLDRTGCRGVLAARGALGNPWIFREVEAFLERGEVLPRPGTEEKKAVLKRHLEYIRRFREGSFTGKLGFMRKVATWYLKGLPRASAIRREIYEAADFGELIDRIESC